MGRLSSRGWSARGSKRESTRPGSGGLEWADRARDTGCERNGDVRPLRRRLLLGEARLSVVPEVGGRKMGVGVRRAQNGR